jgi:hypothetical protein
MPFISLRVTAEEETKINTAAKKSNIGRSKYIRKMIFDPSTLSKMDFFANINSSIEQLTKQSIFTTQLLCHILVNQTGDPEAVQNLLNEINQNMEENDNE